MSESIDNLTLHTVGFDARFPQQNQTRHCYTAYVDYHKCVNAKGEDYAPCQQFFTVFHTLCPDSWIQKWDDQREAGNFPVNLNP